MMSVLAPSLMVAPVESSMPIKRAPPRALPPLPATLATPAPGNPRKPGTGQARPPAPAASRVAVDHAAEDVERDAGRGLGVEAQGAAAGAAAVGGGGTRRAGRDHAGEDRTGDREARPGGA